MRLIGDIHGKVEEYIPLLDCDKSVQIGDFGLGFLTPYEELRALEAQYNGNHRFIRGNHDDPERCRDFPTWIEDGTVEDGVMYIGGAWSIDGAYRRAYEDRTGLKTWWEDEEVSLEDFRRIEQDYLKHRPHVLVTHDAPHTAAKRMFFDTGLVQGEQKPTRTATILDRMFQSYQPALWVFGHWHIDREAEIEGTKFICLGELSHIDV